MAKRDASDQDQARFVDGTFTATGTSRAFLVQGEVNVSLWGTFAATIVPQRSFDGGTTWLPVTYIDGSALQWTAPMSTAAPDSEPGVLYRLACTWTSGTVNYRLSGR